MTLGHPMLTQLSDVKNHRAVLSPTPGPSHSTTMNVQYRINFSFLHNTPFKIPSSRKQRLLDPHKTAD